MQTLINMYRVRGHLIAHLDPLDAEPPHTPPGARPAHLRPHHLGPAPRSSSSTGSRAETSRRSTRSSTILRDAYCRTLGHRVHAHPGSRAEALDPAARRGRHDDARPRRSSAHILDRLNAAEVFERFLHTRYVGQKRFGLEGAESTIVALDASLDEAADVASKRPSWAWRTGAGSTCSPTSSASPTGRSSTSSRATSTPSPSRARGDVKYHKGARGVFKSAGARRSPSPWRRTPRTSRRSTPWSRAWRARSRTASRGRATARRAGRDGAIPSRCCRPRPRRRRLRRAGRRRRDPQPLRARRATAPAAPCTS